MKRGSKHSARSDHSIYVTNLFSYENCLFEILFSLVIIFGTDARLSKATDTVAIKIGDYEINRVYNFKYLGIVLDDSLTWKDHVRYVIYNVGKRVGVLGRLSTESEVAQPLLFLFAFAFAFFCRHLHFVLCFLF